MKRKILLVLLGSTAFLCLAWGFNIAFRMGQFMTQELNPMWRMDQVEQGDGCARSGIADLSIFITHRRYGTEVSFDETFPDYVDLDGDGLSAFEEIVRLTSDQSLDSDNDGIQDPEDRCVDCRALSYRDRLETLLVTEMVCHWGSEKDRVYVVSTGSVDPSSACPDTTFVSAPAWATEYLGRQPETWGPERNPEYGVLRIEPRLYMPGLIYGYDVDYFCGPLCAEESYAFILDLPVFGPVYMGRKVLWIS
jgi:hypothetical protein